MEQAVSSTSTIAPTIQPPTRRRIFGLSAALGALAALPAIARVATPVTAHAELFREANEVDRAGDAVNQTDAAIDAWADMQDRFLARVEALPVSPENVPIRMRALRSLHPGADDIAEFGRQADTTDVRLAFQILASMRGVR